MIYYLTPYHPSDLGTAYNEHIKPLPDDAWICVRDLDTMILDLEIMKVLEKVVDSKVPNIGMYTCLTNRIGEPLQMYQGRINDNPDIKYHKLITRQLLNQKTTVKTVKHSVSGFFMLFKKEVWKQVGGFKKGNLGVDNTFSHDIMNLGYDIGIIQNVYLFHYYRLVEGVGFKEHLK